MSGDIVPLSVLVASIGRVRALHTPHPHYMFKRYCRECRKEYPCPTIQTLETP